MAVSQLTSQVLEKKKDIINIITRSKRRSKVIALVAFICVLLSVGYLVYDFYTNFDDTTNILVYVCFAVLIITSIYIAYLVFYFIVKLTKRNVFYTRAIKLKIFLVSVAVLLLVLSAAYWIFHKYAPTSSEDNKQTPFEKYILYISIVYCCISAIVLAVVFCVLGSCDILFSLKDLIL